jgi:hypothetical protein
VGRLTRMKTPPQAFWEGVQVREFRKPSLSFSESVRSGYLTSPHAHITTPSSRQPKNHLRTVTATMQGDFVCVEKVQAGAHLSTGGNGGGGGEREMRRERERQRQRQREVEEARAANAARRRREFLASEDAKRNWEEQKTPLARILVMLGHYRTTSHARHP